MIFAAAAVLAFLIVAVFVAVLLVACSRINLLGWIVFGGAVVLAALVLFRPHETLLAGQDEAAYLHAAATFERTGRLFVHDEILLKVPVEKRHLFKYAHEGFGWTRDNALNVVDMAQARLGPRFQPAFALLLAGAIRVTGSIRGAYWVTPVSALLLAVVLGLVAARLTRSPYALALGVVLFVSHPLVAWHGRMPRPEFLAALLSVSAALLLMQAALGGRRLFWLPVAALGGALAPFFHVTALSAMLALALVASWVGRRHFLALLSAHLVFLLGGLLFVWQAYALTDHYNLTRHLDSILGCGWGVGLLVMGVVAELTFLTWVALGRGRSSRPPRSAPCRWLGIGAALLIPVLAGLLVWRSTPLPERTFEGYRFAYAALTDMRSVSAYLGGPLFLLALLGLSRLLIGRMRRFVAIYLAAMLLPALLVGTIYDLFISRYLLIGCMPLFVVGLCAWMPRGRRLQLRRAPWMYTMPMVIMVLLAFKVRAMAPLLSIQDYHGMTRVMRRVARPVVKERGILLCDYPRLGAAMQRGFGVPTLSINRDVWRDPSQHLAAWQHVCDAMSNRPAFFLTPFEQPAWGGYNFDLLEEAALQHVKPCGGLFAPPGRNVRAVDKHFRLYRMTPMRSLP